MVASLALLAWLWAAPHLAMAKALQPVLSASVGAGFEVHPAAHVQAENLMLAAGLGLLGDRIRPELGVVTAYGAVWGRGQNTFQYEFRPMLRVRLPLLPLYVRLVFAGISPFSKQRNIAYGGALGIHVPIGPLGLFGEAGPLPRRVAQTTHWVLEARAGLGFSF